MSQEKQRKPSEVTNWADYNKAITVISTQAELKSLQWTRGRVWAVDDVSLRKLRNHLKKARTNLKRLNAWADRVRPSGLYLFAARMLYTQTFHEINITEESLETLSGILDKETE